MQSVKITKDNHFHSPKTEMRSLIYAFNWHTTSLGPMTNWPTALISAIELILNVSTPMFVVWGNEEYFFFNDAYRDLFITANQSLPLGSCFREAWANQWQGHELTLAQYKYQKEVLFKNVPFRIERGGEIEELNFNFSCNAIADSQGFLFIGYSLQKTNLHATRKQFDFKDQIKVPTRNFNVAADELISLASHELKTPITSLKLLIQILRRKINLDKKIAPTPEKIAKTLDIAGKQIDKLIELIDDLLDIGRIKAGRLEFQFKPTCLKGLTENVISRFLSELESAKTKIICDIPEDIIGNWDESRLEQVIVNLISNAIKYAPGQPIHITAVRKKKFAIYIVKDHGPGIAKKKQDIIFKRFERVGGSEVNGAGLGLYIARKIIESHKGKITVRSKLKQGASFIIKLPLDSEG